MKKLFLILFLLFQFSTILGNNQSQDSSAQKIIGTWYTDANRDVKWIFGQDGKVYNYYKDAFKVMYRYTISHTCQNYSDDNLEYLTFMDKDGDEFCFKINAVNENKNGILSLTKMDNMEQLRFVNNINLGK